MNNGFKAINYSKWLRISKEKKKSVVRITLEYEYRHTRQFDSRKDNTGVWGKITIPLLRKREIFGYYYRGFFYFKDVMPNLSYYMWTDAKPTCARISVEWLNKWRWKVEFVNDLIVNSPERSWKEMV